MTRKEEFIVIGKIVDRAVINEPTIDRLSLVMDLDFVNQSNPLKLEDLLNADEGNFWHDISGINAHFNRQTKQLENSFLPRFSK